jgi:hypothetical protein
MTMPAPDDDEREARPLGSDVAPTGDGDADGVAGGDAGPSYPPEATEPDAH